MQVWIAVISLDGVEVRAIWNAIVVMTRAILRCTGRDGVMQ